MNQRIKAKHEKHYITGRHGLYKEFKQMLKAEGLWSRCESQLEILHKSLQQKWNQIEREIENDTNVL